MWHRCPAGGFSIVTRELPGPLFFRTSKTPARRRHTGRRTYRLSGPAAIMSISMRAPGELKLLMQIVVLAGRHSPK
jgi:hypothetical protein